MKARGSARVERDVDGEKRPGREADHADRAEAHPEAVSLFADDLDRTPAVVGAGGSRLEISLTADEVVHPARQLPGRQALRQAGVDGGHPCLERSLIGPGGLHAVLEHERGVPEAGQPARDVEPFVRPRVDRPPSAGHHDHPDPVGDTGRRVHRQRRVGDVAQEGRSRRDPLSDLVRDLGRDVVDPRRRAVGPQPDDLDVLLRRDRHLDSMPHVACSGGVWRRLPRAPGLRRGRGGGQSSQSWSV